MNVLPLFILGALCVGSGIISLGLIVRDMRVRRRATCSVCRQPAGYDCEHFGVRG